MQAKAQADIGSEYNIGVYNSTAYPREFLSKIIRFCRNIRGMESALEN
jgi:hypothetical protein